MLVFACTGCSHTTITTPYFTMRSQANIKGLTVTKTSFHLDDLNHSTPTLAGGKAIGGGATAVGGAILTSGILGAIH